MSDPAEPRQPAGTLVNLAETVVIKAGNVFAVTGRDGSLPVGAPHPLGVYRDDCRFLSGHELRLNGVRPRLLVAAAPVGPEAVHELTNAPLSLAGGRVLPLQTVQVRIERAVQDPDGIRETVRVHSYDREPIELDVELALDADFEAMLAIRGIVPGRDGGVAVEAVAGGVRFSALGRDGVRRATTVTADPAPSSVEGGRLRFGLSLGPDGRSDLRLRYELSEEDDGGGGAAGRPSPPQRAPTPAAAIAIETDDELFNRVLQRSILDVRMLRSQMDGQAYFAAGIPWYATLFGRDSLITAYEMLSFDPPMAAHTLRLLAALRGRRDDPAHDEEPGKVVHEIRVGEVARLGLTPLTRYYGTVDATPLFLSLLADHADWAGDLTLFRDLRPAVDEMLAWIDGPGDRDGDGLLDYAARAPAGLRNQGWKDSEEGILDEYGTPLEPPIALVEAQAYALRAKRRLASLFELDGDAERAGRLRAQAMELAERLERFWLPERGWYAMALDGDGRPSGALASNQGHLLWTLSLSPERARPVRDALMGDRMFSGWGIRTLGEGERGYNPMGYHLGTVWPHDTALIAAGLRQYGYDEDFTLLFEALLEAASNAESYRLPELFAGFERTEFETPVPYPVACQPQAWAAAAIPYLLKVGLGFNADGLRRRLRIRRPSLPRWVNRVEVRGLQVADSTVDLLFERAAAGEHVALTDVRIRGDVEVTLEISQSREPPPLA